MKRVLYFTGYRMVAQEWSGAKLLSSVYFEPDEQGLDLFTAYLKSLKNEPIRLLIDLIEEEFRQVKIPFLRGPDRSQIINRNFTKFFRNSEYRLAKSQSVVKKGRKEERLLLMGLTNQYLLKPWLDIIDSTRTPLSGILSLPLISEDFIARFKGEHECIILVTQQVPSNLRQSVFINGKLILSRLVPIASFYQGDYASDVVRDVEGTQRYLFSQRIIDRTDVISVHILCNERHKDKLTIKCAEDEYFDYHIHNVNDVIDEEKIEINEEQDFSSILFCYHASKKTLANHYANAAEKKYFYHHLAAVTTKVISIILIATSTGLFATSVVKGMLYSKTVNEMQLVEQKYQSKFNQLSASRTDSSTSTTTMQAVVKTVEKIDKFYQARPEDLLVKISQHLSLFDLMRLKKLDWFISNSADAISISDVSWGGKNSGRGRNRSTAAVGKDLYEVAVISGEFLDFDGNYRYALSAVDDLEDAMKVSNDFDSVTVLKRPLDIESNNRLSGDVSSDIKRSENKAEFSIRVVRKVITDEK
jgi:hypothetical protein